MERKGNLIATDRWKGNRETEEVDNPEIQPLGPSFADLPSPITTDILLRLPIKSVLICKCVCTSWHTIVSDPHFAKLHFKRASADVMIRTNDPKRVSRTLHLLEFESEMFKGSSDSSRCDIGRFCSSEDFLEPNCNGHMKLEAKFKLPLRDAKMVLDKMLEAKNGGRKRSRIACKPGDDKFAVVNSCNGFLCLCDPVLRNPLVVCNPITGEFIRLPEACKVENSRDSALDCGFGYHKKTNEYKVIRVYGKYVQDLTNARKWLYNGRVAEMHTLGTGTWKSVGDDDNVPYGLKYPTSMNGALHWLDFSSTRPERLIIRFNFESEKFEMFPSPRVLNYNGMRTLNVSMGELNGYLYLFATSCFNYVNLWMMKNYDVGESWTKIYSIDTHKGGGWPFGLYEPIKLFNNGASILMYHSYNCFLYYEWRGSRFKFFKVLGTKFEFEVFAHIPSLISLKDVVKGDNVEVQNVHSRCAGFKLREENDVLFLAAANVKAASLYS